MHLVILNPVNCKWVTIKREAWAQVVLDDLNQVTAIVGLRAPDLCEAIS